MKINTIKSKRLSEEIYNVELNNGLKIFYMPKKNYVKKYAIYSTNYGSIDNNFVPIGESKETIVPEGIAHFLEHKLFEEPDVNIFDEFAKLGSYVNAFTSNTQTAYLFSCVDKFYENLKLLLCFVQDPYFTDENVEKEKGIIQQEIRMYNDSSDWKVYTNCLSGMYVKHPVKIDIAGTVESIRDINKDLLYKCYNTFYNPSNMLLFMIGDIDLEKAVNIISEKQKKTEKLGEEILRVKVKEPGTINETIIEEKLSVSIPLFYIGYKDLDVGYDGEKLVHKEICSNILLEILFGNSSDFYKELYEEGLINDSFGFQYIGHRDYGHAILGGESNSPKEVYNRIKQNLENIISKGISEEDFNRTKKKLIGYHLMDFNSIENVATSFINYFYKKYSMHEYLNTLDKINVGDIEERCRSFLKKESSCLSIVNPK